MATRKPLFVVSFASDVANRRRPELAEAHIVTLGAARIREAGDVDVADRTRARAQRQQAGRDGVDRRTVCGRQG